jgi:hypothetical protein
MYMTKPPPQAVSFGFPLLEVFASRARPLSPALPSTPFLGLLVVLPDTHHPTEALMHQDNLFRQINFPKETLGVNKLQSPGIRFKMIHTIAQYLP